MAAAVALARDGAGFPAAAQAGPQGQDTTDTIVLTVENMHCGACIRQVEDALVAVPGVSAARVNLTDQRVVASVDGRRVASEALIEALNGAGFRAADLNLDGISQAAARSTDLMRRLGVAGFAAMNIMLLSVSVWSGAGADMDGSVQTLFHWLSALIALPSVAYAGQPFFRSAATALRARRLNMDVPISLGVILATAMSLYQTTQMSEQVYFDAAVTLLAFLLLGRMLDEQMRARASSAATNLLGLRSSAASVIAADSSVTRVPIKAIETGARVLVAAGERIGVDGVVVRGASDVDQSLITGESLPKQVGEGAPVFAGTVNLSQALEIRVVAREDGTLLSEIARLMSAAEQGRGRYVRLADRAARYYAPAVHLLGLSTFLGWMAMGHGWQEALTAAIAVLIITCPCALALAVPAVQIAAASRLFSKGIILKAADGLERLAEVDTIVFDKTGTLTLGEPRLVNLPDVAREVLKRAAALAATSRHPYSRAIVAAARDAGLNVEAGDGVSETAGFGLARVSEGGEERLGSAAWCGIAEERRKHGDLWYKPARGEPVALRFADLTRPDATATIAALAKAGYRIELLSGDAEGPVAAVARDCGIQVWRAGQRPDEKVRRLSDLKQAGCRVLMVGDGLNDAPALAAAHASLSPAAAADISQTAADAIFQGARLAPILELIAVSKSSHRLALQNFAVAVAYNVVFVPLAMAGWVTPLIAAVAMSGSSITVTANAVRLKSKTLEV